MRRYPIWKHTLVAALLILAALYALPSAYPSAPSLEVRPRSGSDLQVTVADLIAILAPAGINSTKVFATAKRAIVSFVGTEDQLKARNLIQTTLGSDAIVALSTQTTAPDWLAALGAKAIALGLDLRGGVHFLLDVDVDFAYERFYTTAADLIKDALRTEQIRSTISSDGTDGLLIVLEDSQQISAAVDIISRTEPRLTTTVNEKNISASLSLGAELQITDAAVGQNVETLRRRVDEIGVAEPVIARQGTRRIVVQMPGLQDTARAKGILGRRAALELRGVEENAPSATIRRARAGAAPVGTELLPYADGTGAVLVERRIVLSGENIVDASYGSDEAGRPAVHLTLDAVGAAKIKSYTRNRIGEQLAIVLIDQDRTEVISAPRIESELHARFLIHGGGMAPDEANELALLLRSGSLATPVEIVEERTIGPSLGADNIRYGLAAVTGGFSLVAVLIAVYYGVFGLISVSALLANLLCLTALLAALGAGLTLPGLAGFALTLGMAIDANVLINERIREELANGQTPGLAIEAGYTRAFATILDANITTLIAGLALFALGSGPVRGFAVVLCLGIVTSMFTAVVVSRAFADLVYGRWRGRLKKISIG